MVVCEDGRMKRREYRKYRIKGALGGIQGSRSSIQVSPMRPDPGLTAQRPDDFAAMREVVQRRYRKVIEDGGPFPDLILVDGGKGQLTAAYDALESIGLGNLVAVGIAKREELLYTRDRQEPIVLAENEPALLLLQRIRDEAHRLCADVSSEGAIDARPAIGARWLSPASGRGGAARC